MCRTSLPNVKLDARAIINAIGEYDKLLVATTNGCLGK